MLTTPRYLRLLIWTATTTSAAVRPASAFAFAAAGRHHHSLHQPATSAIRRQNRSVSSVIPSLTSTGGSLFASQFASPTSLKMSSSSSSTGASDDDNANNHGKLLRVALCQFPVAADKNVNHETAKKYISDATRNGARLVVLPEIWNSPLATAAFREYAEKLPEVGEDVKTAPSRDLLGPSARLLIDAAIEHKLWIVGGSIPELVDGDVSDTDNSKIFNTCIVINPDGDVVAKHRKVHLFDVDVPGGITFFESETISPGSTISHFSTPWGEFGVGICYDMRFAEYAQILRQTYNVCVLIYPGAFNMTTGPAHWEILQRARAVDNQCYVLTASPSRTTEESKPNDSQDDGKMGVLYPHYTAWGHSTAVSPWGDIIATTDEKESLVLADLDLQRVNEVRSVIPIGNQRRTDLYKVSEN